MEHLFCSILQRTGKTAYFICSRLVRERIASYLSFQLMNNLHREKGISWQLSFQIQLCPAIWLATIPGVDLWFLCVEGRVRFSQSFMRVGVEERPLTNCRVALRESFCPRLSQAVSLSEVLRKNLNLYSKGTNPLILICQLLFIPTQKTRNRTPLKGQWR